LAMEEYVARRIDEQDLFFMWQVEPSVIFGRNQLIENEVNLKFCRERGIKTYRRKSGGGCVYADMNNVMFSYITKDETVGFTFNRYINMVVLVLQNLGVDAKASGRNDVMIGDRKVSGNAFYHIPGRSIVHGTMLYDTDMVNMVGAITPTDEKLLSKGVASVRQRIALLKDYINLDIEQFKTFVRNNLCQGEIVLNEEDIRGIEEIEKDYLTDEFIYGNNPKYTIVRKRRIETVGDFEVRIEMKNGEIKGMVMLGDYFIVGDIDDTILRPLKGVRLEREALEKALPEQLDTAILNLRKADFIDLLL
ncbi:MAG: lipoate--protein ligase, partial [Prevotellaceae bacterium]|nr:lipoate--protein ligase [Prevotellaceae bacterium]